jgi:nitric oxide dioxygenase
MVTASQLAALTRTLPDVAAHADAIAADFYDRLFAARPDLLRDRFNRGEHAQGRQARELARTLVALAEAVIDAAPGSGTSSSARAAATLHPTSHQAGAPTLAGSTASEITSRLAQRHAALGIRRHDHPVFESALQEAMRASSASLSDDDEAVDAWTALYRQVTDEVADAVDDLYRHADLEPDEEWREAIVTEHRIEAEDVVALTLVSADSEALPRYRAGQFASVQVELADGAHQIRQYSLRGGPDEQWRISARVIDGGGFVPDGEVSNHLRDEIAVGSVLRVSPPIGSLTIDELDDAPLLFVSAGIGCTPVLGMLDHLARTEPTRQVTVLHFERTPERHAHRAELEALVAAMPNASLRVSYTQGSLSALTAAGGEGEGAAGGAGEGSAGESIDGQGAYLDPIDLGTVALTPEHRVFLCGPVPFMAIARAALIEHGVEAERVHYFVFGPDDGSVTGIDTGQRRR